MVDPHSRLLATVHIREPEAVSGDHDVSAAVRLLDAPRRREFARGAPLRPSWPCSILSDRSAETRSSGSQMRGSRGSCFSLGGGALVGGRPRHRRVMAGTLPVADADQGYGAFQRRTRWFFDFSLRQLQRSLCLLCRHR